MLFKSSKRSVIYGGKSNAFLVQKPRPNWILEGMKPLPLMLYPSLYMDLDYLLMIL